MVKHSSLYFFFSSRRRHTRSLRDWSSDVCSSDLERGRIAANALIVFGQGHGTEDLGLHLPAHIHAGAVNDEDLCHDALLALAGGNFSRARLKHPTSKVAASICLANSGKATHDRIATLAFLCALAHKLNQKRLSSSPRSAQG